MDVILNAVPCGFLTFSDDGVVRSTNETLLDMLGRGGESLVGRHVEELFTVAGRIFYQTHFFPLLKMAGRAEEIYLSLRTVDGVETPVLVNGVRRERDGEVIYDCILVAMRRRSQFEDEILRAKRNLEEANRAKDEANAELELTKRALERKQKELQDRNCELEILKERLEDQVQERTAELRQVVADLQTFSYAIAHDLQTPLRAILSTSEILRQEAATTLSEHQAELLSRQAINARRLANLVNDLQRFAGLSRQGMVREPINITQIAMETIASLSATQQRMRPTFSVQSGMRGVGDRAFVRIAFQNLIENAVKYSPDGGEIRIGFEEGKFFVRDRGIGFDMEFAEKIFLPFERLHSQAEYEGSGIGLATTKRIIERHGGRVWAESTPGEGSTFFFTLG